MEQASRHTPAGGCARLARRVAFWIMRRLVPWFPFCLCALFIACAPETSFIDRPVDRIVEVPGQYDASASADVLEASPSDAGDAAVADSSADADAGPFVCTGGMPADGGPSNDCYIRGACDLSTCAGGQLYECRLGGFPAGLTKCVHHTTDGGITGHCCEPACVRWAQEDVECPVGTLKAYSCAPGFSAPAAGCKKLPSFDDAFCCP